MSTDGGDVKKLQDNAFAFLFCVLAVSGVSAKERNPISEQQIKKQIIEESIASYSGRCPCPYNAARNGSSCGGRSAWSRKGGYAPICFEREVTSEMVRERRERDRQVSRQEGVPTR